MWPGRIDTACPFQSAALTTCTLHAPPEHHTMRQSFKQIPYAHWLLVREVLGEMNGPLEQHFWCLSGEEMQGDSWEKKSTRRQSKGSNTTPTRLQDFLYFKAGSLDPGSLLSHTQLLFIALLQCIHLELFNSWEELISLERKQCPQTGEAALPLFHQLGQLADTWNALQWLGTRNATPGEFSELSLFAAKYITWIRVSHGGKMQKEKTTPFHSLGCVLK